jgi:hypothetical protein
MLRNNSLIGEAVVVVNRKFTPVEAFWFDLIFSCQKVTNENLKIISNRMIYGDAVTPSDDAICFMLSYDATDIYFTVLSYPSLDVIDKIKIASDSVGVYHSYRLCYFENTISIYIDGSWGYTAYIPNVIYANGNSSLIALSSNAQTLKWVNLSELSENRKAIYVDIESPGFNAVASVIEDRPIQMYPKSDGSIDFTYKRGRTSIGVDRYYSLTKESQMPTDTGSDILVYGVDVSNISDLNFAKEYGWSTKMFRLPSLVYGAVDAAKILARNAMQRRNRYSGNRMRPDLRVELGDIIVVPDYDANTGYSTMEKIIIEQISLKRNERSVDWNFSGRSAE